MMGEPVRQSGGHIGVAEDARPFAESEVGRDDDRALLIKAADEVEQQRQEIQLLRRQRFYKPAAFPQIFPEAAAFYYSGCVK